LIAPQRIVRDQKPDARPQPTELSCQSKEFCKKAFEAGMRYAYLQFERHRQRRNAIQIGNLFT